MRMIESHNPEWEDLFGRVINGTKAGSPAAGPSEQPLGESEVDKEVVWK